jgi:O-methyltransferase involved in polyketide biosynthesis
MVATGTRKVLIIAEGLFMYLEEDRVRELLLGIQRKFPGCELAAEVFSATWIKRLRSPYIRRKFRRQLHMNDDALFTFGVEDSRAFERIGPGFSLIGEWSYFDDKEKKLGWYNFLGKFSAFKKIQWMVRYRIDLQ